MFAILICNYIIVDAQNSRSIDRSAVTNPSEDLALATGPSRRQRALGIRHGAYVETVADWLDR